MSEMCGGGGGSGGGGGGGGGGVDPSNLYLVKELTQIRKAARGLRDPGTSSSRRSPLNSARFAVLNGAEGSSSARNRYYHHYRNNSSNDYRIGSDGRDGDVGKALEHKSKFPFRVENNSNRKDKGGIMYNRGSQKSERRGNENRVDAASAAVDDEVNGEDDISSMPEESVEDSLSNARNGGGDSKSDTYIADTNASNSKRIRMKKKSMKPAHSTAVLKHHIHQLQQQVALSRSSKRVLGDLTSSLGGDESMSLVDQSDDTGEYFNSENLRWVSAALPLLSRLRSSKLLRGSHKEDSSYGYSTPALSTSSFKRYGVRNPSTVRSWDATTESFNDGDDEVDDQLDLPGDQGCGIPCYWSKRTTPKRRGVCPSCCSPSLSDTLRKGCSILCGSRTMCHRRSGGLSLSSNKRKLVSRTAQGRVPLLTSSGDGRGGSSIETGHSDDELSTNFGELDLEALSRLDGRRWSSSCRSQEGLDLIALSGEGAEERKHENARSLSQKYRPMFFEELIGQNDVVQSLMNVIMRGRIGSIYLFQGPRGTGKTSTARIFTAALNCLANEETKPCGICRECADFISVKSRDLWEVDGSNKKGIDRVMYLLTNLSVGPSSAFLRFKVFVIDECHLLPTKTWLAFLKFLEEPPPCVVFIFVTTDLDNVPCTVLPGCQKYLFNKIKDGDIVTRLKKIAADETLDVQSDALNLIALNADGSLRDAETLLDQLSVSGKRITTSLVKDLVGAVSDEKLFDLLEFAMSSDIPETVKRARELMDSGVDPMVLVSKLASLVVDLMAGTYHIIDSRCNDSFSGGRSLAEAELERLKHTLKLLSEAEKQLRVSGERSTWFMATLLQLGSVPSSDPTQLRSSKRQISRTTEEDPSSTFREEISLKQRSDVHYALQKSTSPMSLPKATHRNSTSPEESFSLKDGVCFNSKPAHSLFLNDDALSVSHDDFMVGNTIPRCINSNVLDDIWVRCIERCHSKTLRQLLHTFGKLVSISEVEGVFVANIAFGNREIKGRAERFLSSITNSFEIVLHHNTEVRIILLPDDETSINSANQVVLLDPLIQKQKDTTKAINGEKKAIFSNAIDLYSNLDSHQKPVNAKRGTFNDSEGNLAGFESTVGSSVLLVEGNAKLSGTNERKPEIPVQSIESIVCDQRLETAWLQNGEKGTPGLINRLKPERNQVLPQGGIYHYNQMEINSQNLTSQQWEDELNHEVNALKINEREALEKDQIARRIDPYPMSPSLLHDRSFVGNFSKESMGYESGSGAGGCGGLLCWNNKHHKMEKNKQGTTPVHTHKVRRFLWFGECAKSRRMRIRFRR